jgi:RimJ/RimL family protein N-acetyltransferase
MIQQNIHTPRLHLRAPTAADIPFIQVEMENHEVNKWVEGAPWPYAPGSAAWFIHNHCFPKLNTGEAFIWAITEKTTGEFLGLIEYGVKKGYVNRGFWLKQSAWNKGYMQEATSATLHYIFTHTPFEMVEAYNVKSNAASRNVKLRNGFKFFELRHEKPKPGKVQDGTLEYYRLTKTDWLALQK